MWPNLGSGSIFFPMACGRWGGGIAFLCNKEHGPHPQTLLRQQLPCLCGGRPWQSCISPTFPQITAALSMPGLAPCSCAAGVELEAPRSPPVPLCLQTQGTDSGPGDLAPSSVPALSSEAGSFGHCQRQDPGTRYIGFARLRPGTRILGLHYRVCQTEANPGWQTLYSWSRSI